MITSSFSQIMSFLDNKVDNVWQVMKRDVELYVLHLI